MDAGELPDSEGKFSTKQVVRSLFGDVYKERLRAAREYANKLELANQASRGELLPAAELRQAFAQVALSICAIIDHSDLPTADRVDIRHQISAIPVIIADAVSSARRRTTADKSRSATGHDGEDVDAADFADEVPARRKPRKRRATAKAA